MHRERDQKGQGDEESHYDDGDLYEVQETTRRFRVNMKNRFEGTEEPERIVTIKVIEIIFDDRVCSLVYMQDLTKFIQENETIRQTENLLRASKCISQRI